jgi:hypothetical protein
MAIPENTNYHKAAKFQLLADYYKYVDPNKHLYYYQKHYNYLQRWLADRKQENQQRINENRNGLVKVRVLHASPNAPDVDIYLNGENVLKSLMYTNSSAYLDIKAGTYQLEIYPAGSKKDPVQSAMVEVESDKSYTIAAGGLLEDLQVVVIEDDSFVPRSESKLRFLHLSPGAPPVDIAVRKGDVVFPNIAFSQLTEYLGLTPMTIDLEVRIAGTKDVVLPLNRVNVKPDLAYTIAVVGLSSNTPPLNAVFLVP